MSPVFEHLDEAVERLGRLRDDLLADEFALDRSARLAAVFQSEARAWSQLFELSSLRLVWRAALAAETGARANAVLWTRRAAAERAAEPSPAENEVVGRMSAPHLVVLYSVNAVGGRS